MTLLKYLVQKITQFATNTLAYNIKYDPKGNKDLKNYKCHFGIDILVCH